MDDGAAADRRRGMVLAGLTALALIGAVFLPVPQDTTLTTWREIASDIAIVVVTIAAIWLGMLFGVALERAREGSGSGASLLIRELMRPLRVGGITLVGALFLTLAWPYIQFSSLPHPWKAVAMRLQLFASFLVCVGALYGLLLSLAPVDHILRMLRSREVEADAHPPSSTEDLVGSGKSDPWRS
jgi:hypothetical protein